jgi:hydrogenase-4 component E
MQQFFDLIYLLIVLSGIIILIENRVRRLILFTSIQGFLLIFPVIQTHGINHYQSWVLLGMIIIFKTILTPYTMLWTIRQKKETEHTTPRYGYLVTTIIFSIGLGIAILIADSIGTLPQMVDRIELIYVFLLIYLGIVSFIIRQHWLGLISGFTIFENGIFILALILADGLPIGIELGAFVDTLLVIISAAVLQIRADALKQEIKT